MTGGRVRVVALMLVLTACSSSGGEPQAEPTASPSTSSAPTESTDAPEPTETTPEASSDRSGSPGASPKETRPPEPTGPPPYLPVPEGVRLTERGSELQLGERAVVAWRPRPEVVGALGIRVTGVTRTTRKDFAAFRLDRDQRRSTPYYVRATIGNVGRTDLAGVSVPLYVVNDQDTLIQATPFAAAFEPCPSEPFPTPFTPGVSAEVCLVYLVPERGVLTAVSFRPTQEYAPITWTGRLETP